MTEETTTIAVSLLDKDAVAAMVAAMKDAEKDTHAAKAVERLTAEWPRMDGMITLPTEVLRPHAKRLLQRAGEVEQSYVVQKSIPRLQAL